MSTVNPTYARLELRRIRRDVIGLFFTAVLPAFMYVIFGAATDYKDESAGHGNVAMYIMVSMAAYGAVTATVSTGGSAAVERMQGWGRQLGLTPMTDVGYVVNKTVVGLAVACLPIGLIFAIGALTGARGDLRAWVLSALVVLAGAALFSVYGLACGLFFRSESAVGAASGSLVILGFLGNIFFPLSGALLTVAKFTPLYGYISLARWPVTDGNNLDQASGTLVQEQLWVPVANLVAWTLILVTLTIWLVRRGRERQ